MKNDEMKLLYQGFEKMPDQEVELLERTWRRPGARREDSVSVAWVRARWETMDDGEDDDWDWHGCGPAGKPEQRGQHSDYRPGEL